MSHGSSTLAPGRVDFDRDVEARLEDAGDDTDYAGWFCIATAAFPCPAEGCDFVALFCTAAHHVVVWPAKDDRALLSTARDARLAGRNPRVVEYEQSFGPCITYDLWRKIGRPVHGRLPDPDGWDAATPRL